jgi:hypothetical protein
VLAETDAFQSITEFAGHAVTAGLRYLCDAELHDGADGAAGDELDAREDRIAREQQLDVFRLRMFRQAVLVRDDSRATERLDPRAIAELHVRSSLRPPRGSPARATTRRFRPRCWSPIAATRSSCTPGPRRPPRAPATARARPRSPGARSRRASTR